MRISLSRRRPRSVQVHLQHPPGCTRGDNYTYPRMNTSGTTSARESHSAVTLIFKQYALYFRKNRVPIGCRIEEESWGNPRVTPRLQDQEALIACPTEPGSFTKFTYGTPLGFFVPCRAVQRFPLGESGTCSRKSAALKDTFFAEDPPKGVETTMKSGCPNRLRIKFGGTSRDVAARCSKADDEVARAVAEAPELRRVRAHVREKERPLGERKGASVGFIDRGRRAKERKERSFGVHPEGVEPGLSAAAAPIMQRFSWPPDSCRSRNALLTIGGY
ncbi:hypothetical protein KM043_015328 [Ampulex compressa]|nr:hypothetical protein KM043_015328 [Ampulex compressa]